MNLRYSLVAAFLCVGLMGSVTSSSKAQVSDIGAILQASAGDANLLVKEYLKPFGSGFGASLNSGWTNTGVPHKTLGFDLTVSTGLSVVPKMDKTFNVEEIGLKELELEDPNASPIAQTINGSDASGPTLAAYTDDGLKLLDFELPGGTNFGYVPAPEIKAGVGIIMDTELMLRYVPQVNFQDYGTFDQYGLGVKHGLNQWLPGGALLPVDLTFMAGYTKQTLSSGFRLTGEDIIVDKSKTENPYANKPGTWDGQEIQIQTEAMTVNALVGKNLPLIAVYGGVGYEMSSMSVATPGMYPTIGENPDYYVYGSSQSKPLIVKTMEEPVKVELKGSNGFHALAGFRLRFTIFHISASYKLADYSTFNAGFGISFR